ncbi:hypothetical protein LR48_Vigan11g113300 [Vigna angularis]|uniref:Uncharacterized protein n=1 Tax=Phaseolus angularis TaxID=3914 RepID=A0A0L9VTL7_PHAAN|nr:hypothetical protein LR48_Vigan11g113300 [Vigna angularis]
MSIGSRQSSSNGGSHQGSASSKRDIVKAIKNSNINLMLLVERWIIEIRQGESKLMVTKTATTPLMVLVIPRRSKKIEP